MAPKRSVCMATFNGEAFVAEQISSILPQLSSDDEVIISDDGSTDSTTAEVARFRDPRIRLIANREGQRGIVANFENALKHSSGRIIFLADQDDLWEASKVALLGNALRTAVLATSDCRFIDTCGRTLTPSFLAKRNAGPGFWKNFFKNGYMGCCMAFRRELLDLALPFPKHIPMHDMWIALLGELLSRPVFLSDRLVRFRCHSHNASLTSSGGRLPLRQQVLLRVGLLPAVIARAYTRGKTDTAAVRRGGFTPLDP